MKRCGRVREITDEDRPGAAGLGEDEASRRAAILWQELHASFVAKSLTSLSPSLGPERIGRLEPILVRRRPVYAILNKG